MFVSRAWRVRAILSLLLSVLAVNAFAAADPATSAIAWLNAHQNPDGSWGSLSELTARDTARVLIARQAANSSDVQTTRAAVWLAGQQGITANQFIAEQALAITGAKMNAGGIVSLLAVQHAPTGADFGSFSDQTGNTFDSALAIEAFSSDEATYAGTISAILSSLTLRQNADGGWGLDRGFDSSPVWTAEVLIALSRLQIVKPQKSMIAAAQGYLVSLVHPDGSIGSGPLDTAVSLRALALTAYPLTTANATLAYLGTQQSADGSWSGSAYLTARALEAFASKKPNLVIDPSDVTFTPNPVVENVTFSVTLKVRNTGFADASSPLFPKVVIYDRTAGGPWLGEFTFGTVPALGISGLITARLNVSGVSTSHDLVLVADGGNTVDELSEIDNALTISFPVVARADLQIFQSDIAVSPARPQPGEAAQANVTIRNGGGTDTGAFEYVVYDGIDGAAESVLLRGTMSLPAGAAQTVVVPFVATAGTHVLHAVADSANAISESSETNNDAKQSIAISRGSDVDLVLAAGSVTSSVAQPSAGAPIRITATITNAGSAPAQSSVAFFDGVPAFGGTRIGTVPITVDAAGTASVVFDYVTTPSSGVIYAVADPDGTLPEIDERNNQAFVALTDQVVDLAIDRADILVPKIAVTNGQPVAGRIIIRNRGAVAATGVDVAIYDDLPQNGGIRTVTASVNVPANGTTVVPFTWPARAGQRFATVVLNGSHAVPELDYANDRATRAYIANGTTAGVQISLFGGNAIDLSELISDATTLAVSGNVRIAITMTASCTVSVFEDVDGDRAYNPEVDTLLGSTLLPANQGFV
ncbi:MAG: conserved repeat domain protein, partial [Acidobacteria bacterium]|nr:conserved repeat domain protein [Acidobacteriota bacterium]